MDEEHTQYTLDSEQFRAMGEESGLSSTERSQASVRPLGDSQRELRHRRSGSDPADIFNLDAGEEEDDRDTDEGEIDRAYNDDEENLG